MGLITFAKTIWVNGVTKLSSTQLNRIESGIEDCVNEINSGGGVSTSSGSLVLNVNSHLNSFLYLTNTTTVTIPSNVNSAFPIGAEITICRYGIGEVSITPYSGVTLHSEGEKRRINLQYQAVTLKKILIDTWILIGALKA
jgi:hypothetical protein